MSVLLHGLLSGLALLSRVILKTLLFSVCLFASDYLIWNMNCLLKGAGWGLATQCTEV